MKTLKKQHKNKDIENPTHYIPACKKIKLLPTLNQQKILNDWIAATRKVWNVCIHHIRRNKLDPTKLKETELRDLFVIKKNMPQHLLKQLDWTFRTPKRVREYAIRDILASYKSCLTQLKNKRIKSFNIKLKGNDAKRQNICVSHETTSIINGKLKLSDELKGIKLDVNKNPKKNKERKDKEMIKDGNIDHNSRIIKENGEYFIFIPRYINPEEEERECLDTNKIVSIDPGINIFGTLYCPDGQWGELGSNVKEKLNTIYKKIDRINGKKTLKNRNKRKAVQKQKEKIVNLIEDFQWKLVHWLLDHYKQILIPRLYVRKTNAETKRYFKDMEHCRFVDRLKYKAMFYDGRIVHEVKEHYTSSVCVKCGSMSIVKGKTIQCNKCGWEMHRDLSGAIAILMKYLKIPNVED